MYSAPSKDCPELALARSWRLQLSAARSEAEEWLGLVPARLRRRWRPAPAAGALVDVPEGGEEFQDGLGASGGPAPGTLG